MGIGDRVETMQTSAAWRNHITLLILMSVAIPLAFNTWSALLNNFAVEQAAGGLSSRHHDSSAPVYSSHGEAVEVSSPH